MLKALSPSQMSAQARYIPKGSVKVADKNSDAVAYVYTNHRGQPAAIAYAGKGAKPYWHFNFRSEADRERRIKGHFQARQGYAEMMANRKKEASKPHKLEVGHILVASWGYEQTNIDWYEVTKVIGPHTVEVREIASNVEHAGQDHGHCFPRAGVFTGAPKVCRVRHNAVKISECQRASLWDGRGRSWSSWH